MITLSLNFAGTAGKSERVSQEKKVKEIIDTHLAFPGSDKLKLGVTIKDNGSSSVSFAGPQDIVDEAKRLWRENVAPAVHRVQLVAGKTTASVKRKIAVARKKISVPKVKKKVRAVVKKAAPKKKTAPKRKKK